MKTRSSKDARPSNGDVQAEAIRSALEEIRVAAGGHLLPDHVVQSAEDPQSVLHPYFEWDDEEASHQYRLAQARGLVRRVRFVETHVDRKTKTVSIRPVRLYESSPVDRHTRGGYLTIDQLMADPDRREALLQNVLLQLANLRTRYDALHELAEVWSTIDDAAQMFSPAKSAPDAGDAETRPSA